METSAAGAAQDDAPSSQGVLVVLCTYNEADNLPRVIERLWDSLPKADILVIDDNSPDGTGQWAAQMAREDQRLHLISRSRKLGLGTALHSGIEWCLERDYEFMINLDADLSHDPDSAQALLARCRDVQAACDVAIGSRYIAGGGAAGLPWHRRLLSWLLNAYATRLLRLPVSDCSGSFRCYRVATLARLDLNRLSCTGYGFLEEILVHLQRAGANFCELPILFESRASGRSKLSIRDAGGVLRVIHRLALRTYPKTEENRG